MILQPTFQFRDFSEGLSPGDLALKINSMRWNAIGGCDQAVLTATGGETALWELIEYLRCPITIFDAFGQPCWWGFVNEVRIRVGQIEIGVSLDSMFNSVAVAYSYVEPGTAVVGTRKTTAWTTNAESVAEYGQKDLLISQGGMTDTSAVARRDAVLAARKYPGIINYPGGYGAQQAVVTCKGWWHTTAWRYAAKATTASVATTTQIGNLVTTYGAFLTATDIEAASGISTSEYRDGDSTLMQEINALLAVGKSSGRRYLADVDINRRLQVYEEPANTTVSYHYGTDGILKDALLSPVTQYLSPVGRWARLHDVIPASADVTKLANPELHFIEGATWTPQGGLRPVFRGQPTIEDSMRFIE